MGGFAHFLFVKSSAGSEDWLEATLRALGYELVDLEHSRSGLVRVFMDKPGGITVDDCATVSNHLTRLFAVEGVAYERLEVSSPGLDRPLKRLADFERFTGQQASVRLKLPRDGRRRLQGVLAGVEAESVQLDVEGRRWTVALSEIEKARLVPEV
jgi:ribosome maturation factor RimP